MISELKFVALHYFALGLLTLLSYVFGRRLTSRVTYGSPLEKAALSVTLGLGVIAYIVMLLGLLGILYAWALIIVLLLGLGICYPVWRGWARALPVLWKRVRPFGKGRLALILTGAVVVLALSTPMLALPLYPPAPTDAGMYHLASAKIYGQQHKLVYTPDLRYPVLPQTNQMLFTLALLLYDDGLAQLVEFLMMVTLAIAVIAFGQRHISIRAGLWAAALLLGNSLVLWLGSLAYIDMGVTLFVTTTVYAFWNWLWTRERSWLLLAAVFCGFAVGTKIPALFFLGTLTMVALYVSSKKRDYLSPILFTGIALIVAAPWLARCFYYTRNPVFPEFYDQIGRWFGYGHSRREYYEGLAKAIASSGMGKSFKSLIMLPWRLAFNQKPFQIEAHISPIYFLALPLWFLFGIARARMRGLLLLTLAYVLFWFYTVQVMRFLIPVVPFLSLLTAGAFDRVAGWLPGVRHLTVRCAITALGCAVLISQGWHYTVNKFREAGRLPVTQEQRDSYLRERLPAYAAYKLLNDLKGRNYSLYSLRQDGMNYFADGRHMGDWFGASRYALIDERLGNAEALFKELRTLGAEYFIFSTERQTENLSKEKFFRSHFKPLLEQQNVHLFELSETPIEPEIRNILLNPDFEELNFGRPVAWAFNGGPVVEASGQHSFSGLVAVLCDHPNDVLYQTVDVEQEKNYVVSCEARGSGQRARLQVNWLNAGGVLLKEDKKVIELNNEWKRYAVRLEAPAQAVRATLYAGPLDSGSVWFDNFSFGKIE